MLFLIRHRHLLLRLFFFNDTATTEIYTLSLHDALPISASGGFQPTFMSLSEPGPCRRLMGCRRQDRKSTRLNSSHLVISYAVFCLKKKNKKTTDKIKSTRE